MKLRLFTLAVLVLSSSLAFAGKKKIAQPYPGKNKLEIQVDGLTCPFCGYGLEKRLKKVKFIQKTTIFVDEGRAVALLSPNAAIDLSAAEKAVRDGGYTPRKATLDASGILKKDGERWTFLIGGSGTPLTLAENKELRELVASGPNGRTVRVKGALSSDAIGKKKGIRPPTLLIEAYSVEPGDKT